MEEMRTSEAVEAKTDSAEETLEILEEIAIEELAIDGICGVY